MASATINIRGYRLRTQTMRRYIVVSTYGLTPSIAKRSDNLETARTHQRRDRANRFIVDTITGTEVA